MNLKKNLIDKFNQQINVLEQKEDSCPPNVTEQSSKLKTCCFYNDNNRRYDSVGTKLQKKVRESDIETFQHHLIEDSSSYDNEISRVKDILKIGTPFR